MLKIPYIAKSFSKFSVTFPSSQTSFTIAIFSFRSLAQQMNEILDAMFEKKVKPEDVIIRQGDDGDNFYVIES